MNRYINMNSERFGSHLVSTQVNSLVFHCTFSTVIRL